MRLFVKLALKQSTNWKFTFLFGSAFHTDQCKGSVELSVRRRGKMSTRRRSRIPCVVVGKNYDTSTWRRERHYRKKM